MSIRFGRALRRHWLGCARARTATYRKGEVALASLQRRRAPARANSPSAATAWRIGLNFKAVSVICTQRYRDAWRRVKKLVVLGLSGPDRRMIEKECTMPHPVDVHVGKRIRHRRWLIGMTQQQLAEAVGIKFQQIQKYETGANRVSASRLWDMAEALEVDISFFFEGLAKDTEEGSTTLPADIIADKEALDLVRSYYAIPETQRKRLF